MYVKYRFNLYSSWMFIALTHLWKIWKMKNITIYYKYLRKQTPQNSICCPFWHAVLLTTAVSSSHVSYRSILISSIQSGRSSLTSLVVNKAFWPADLLLTGFFYTTLWKKIKKINRHCWSWNFMRSTQKYWNQPIWCHSQSHQDHGH